MRILIVAGGTGGHIYPAVALLDYLRELNKNLSILWVGGGKNVGKESIQNKDIDFAQIRTRPLPRSLNFRWISFFFYMGLSLVQSFKIILSFKPNVVVGMGSFQSFPLVLSAWICGVPCLICEQNVFFSLTNKMLLPLASRIALSFPHTINKLPNWARKKALVTGNPVREEIVTTSRREGIEKMDLEKEKFTLLFLGGSQGASYLNRVAIQTLHLLRESVKASRLQFILLTGEKDYDRVKEQLTKVKIRGVAFPFLHEIHYAYAASDLIISRSGATTLAEIIVRGIPCILVPYPFATCNHQLKNALVLEKEGSAKVITQDKLDAPALRKTIEDIIVNPEMKKKMKQLKEKWGQREATKNLAELVLQLGKKRF